MTQRVYIYLGVDVYSSVGYCGPLAPSVLPPIVFVLLFSFCYSPLPLSRYLSHSLNLSRSCYLSFSRSLFFFLLFSLCLILSISPFLLFLRRLILSLPLSLLSFLLCLTLSIYLFLSFSLSVSFTYFLSLSPCYLSHSLALSLSSLLFSFVLLSSLLFSLTYTLK